ncbi:hypothetical protein [Streptomyces sp. NPDC059371]|uniref:hypothetical protein n=1 Tax=Streptomyces sp. NPDC059371 TaxID=3346812 RepID=UPI00369A7C10
MPACADRWPRASSPLRLTADQILENATGGGAPPRTWPREELLMDLLHKSGR